MPTFDPVTGSKRTCEPLKNSLKLSNTSTARRVLSPSSRMFRWIRIKSDYNLIISSCLMLLCIMILES